MATKFVADILMDGHKICSIENDNPIFGPLVEYLIQNKDANIETLDIQCEDDLFDKECLKETIIESFKDFQNKISLDEKAFAEIMKSKTAD